MNDRRKLIVILAVGVLVLSLCYAWFLPVRSEPIYGDYTHISPHPSCSGWCVDEWDEDFWGVAWENLTPRQQGEFALVRSCCIYHEEPYPLKGGHAYYNLFGIELYREWEWIS